MSTLWGTFYPFYQTSNDEVKPYSDYRLAASLEKLLSFYWYGPDQYQQIASMTEKADIALKLFDARAMTVTKVAEAADENDTPERFGKLISDLASLPERQRNDKIQCFNDILYEIEKPSKNANVINWLLTGAGFLPLTYGQSVVLNMLSVVISKLRNTSKMEEDQKREFIKKAIEGRGKKADESDIDDICVLDKINRVVSLRTS